MELNNRMLLTNEQQLVAREWEALFKHPAWEWLKAEAQQAREAYTIALVQSISTEGDLRDARGRIAVLTWLLETTERKEREFNSLTDDAELSREEFRDSVGSNS